MFGKMEELRNVILLEKESILNKNTPGIKKAKTKPHRKQVFGEQKSVINNALKLYHRKKYIINAFLNKAIYSVDFKKDVCCDCERLELKLEESKAEEQK